MLVICIIAIGSILDYMGRDADDTALLDTFKAHFLPVFSLVGQQLSETDNKQWPEQIDQLSETTGLDLQLYDVADFATDETTLAQLYANEVLALFDSQDQLTLYRRIAQSQQVLGIPVAEWANSLNYNNWIVPAFYILIAVVVFVLIQPFSRQLLKLKSAAANFGRGEFNTRINLPTGSTLEPIVDGFNSMADRIEQLVSSQRELTNSVSHELRTPLARLRFAFEDIQAKAADASVVQQLDEMREDVSELEILVDEMLSYAEINQIKSIRKKPVPLMSFMDDLVADLHSAETVIELNYDNSINRNTVIACNRHHLHRAVANVVRNAMRFANRRCEINVSRLQENFVFDINDDGPGLDREHLERIFEPFYKGKSSKGGFGLGLSIAQGIAQKHGGSLTAIEHPSSGGHFRFLIPA